MFKQSHRNRGSNFNSSGAYAQLEPTVANGTDIADEQEIGVDKSKEKKKSREEVPPVYAEVDKSKKEKKRIDNKNHYETLGGPKKVFILVFLIYYTAIYRLQI